MAFPVSGERAAAGIFIRLVPPLRWLGLAQYAKGNVSWRNGISSNTMEVQVQDVIDRAAAFHVSTCRRDDLKPALTMEVEILGETTSSLQSLPSIAHMLSLWSRIFIRLVQATISGSRFWNPYDAVASDVNLQRCCWRGPRVEVFQVNSALTPSNGNPILGSLDFTRSQSYEYRLSRVFVSNGTEYSDAAVMWFSGIVNRCNRLSNRCWIPAEYSSSGAGAVPSRCSPYTTIRMSKNSMAY